MKTIQLIIIIFSILLINKTANAQCVSPDVKFANPVLVDGIALAEGAVYRFPEVLPGVDCFIKLKKLNGGAVLISMETPGQGYPDAWQPIIGGPGSPVGNKSWIDWEIYFKTIGGNNYVFPCLDISAIDVDGDYSVIGEFVESEGHANYTIPSPTFLTLTDMGSGRLEAQAAIINRPSIDTGALDVRIGFTYNGKDKIDLKLGSTVLGVGTSATERLNCIYFKRMVIDSYIILPVKFVSLQATALNNKVDLNWLTENETNSSHYEIERSFDGNYYNTIAIVLDGFTVNTSSKRYKIKDNSPALTGRAIAYYRIKQVDAKGNFTYSGVVAVSLQAAKAGSMVASPNPFKDKLSLDFKTSKKGIAIIRMLNVTGQAVAHNSIIINKEENTLQLESLAGLSKGVYVAQVIMNGKVLASQKVIKD